mmetsp:Transcript_19426/g.61840  ORF Transcript_19426/g.61840 Transcript_19426/m.61840 type:complete len:242 (-) Transcript_19426:971-1696(-)
MPTSRPLRRSAAPRSGRKSRAAPCLSPATTGARRRSTVTTSPSTSGARPPLTSRLARSPRWRRRGRTRSSWSSTRTTRWAPTTRTRWWRSPSLFRPHRPSTPGTRRTHLPRFSWRPFKRRWRLVTEAPPGRPCVHSTRSVSSPLAAASMSSATTPASSSLARTWTSRSSTLRSCACSCFPRATSRTPSWSSLSTRLCAAGRPTTPTCSCSSPRRRRLRRWISTSPPSRSRQRTRSTGTSSR